MKATLGSQRLTTAWTEFTEEEARPQQDNNATGDKTRTPSIEGIAQEKGVSHEGAHSKEG